MLALPCHLFFTSSCPPRCAQVAALTKRKLVAGGERITRHMNLDAALDNRDALAKALYAQLFAWLVDQVGPGTGRPRWSVGRPWSGATVWGREGVLPAWTGVQALPCRAGSLQASSVRAAGRSCWEQWQGRGAAPATRRR